MRKQTDKAGTPRVAGAMPDKDGNDAFLATLETITWDHDVVPNRAAALGIYAENKDGLWMLGDQLRSHGPFTDEEAIDWLDHEALAIICRYELQEMTAQKRVLEIRLAWREFQPPNKDAPATANDELDFLNAELRAIGNQIRAAQNA